MKKSITSAVAAVIISAMLVLSGCGSEIAPTKGGNAETENVKTLSAETPKTLSEIKTVGGEAVAFPDTDITLIKNKKSDYKVVIGKDALRAEKYAAEELVYFLNESTGCELPIVTDENLDENGKYLSVGNTKLLTAANLTPDYAELGDNGVSVYTRNGNVYMAGAAEYGTLFSVYRFLYYQINFLPLLYLHIFLKSYMHHHHL